MKKNVKKLLGLVFATTMVFGTKAFASESLFEQELRTIGIEQTKLDALTDIQKDSIYHQWKNYDLSDDKVDVMVDDFFYDRIDYSLDLKEYDVDENGNYVDENGNVYVDTLKNVHENNKEEKYFNGNPIDYVNSSDNTGVHWIVMSEGGYHEVTGFATIPSLPYVNSIDRPYMYFGAYTTDGQVVGDYGIVYTPSNQSWSIFRNAGVWNGTEYSLPDRKKYFNTNHSYCRCNSK